MIPMRLFRPGVTEAVARRRARYLALAAIIACGQSDARPPNGAATDARPENSSPGGAVPTAARPNDTCGWIPASEVEALVGPLSGPPIPAGRECHYPLRLADSIRARMFELRRSSQEFAGKPMEGSHPDSVAVILTVDVSGNEIINERAFDMTGDMMSRWLMSDGRGAAPAAQQDTSGGKPPPGWDRAGSVSIWSGFSGRVGHITVTTYVWDALRTVPPERLAALAARVRDAIKDFPFAALDGEYDYVIDLAAPSDPDPCTLVTTAEAESVLGSLLVPPYRSTGESPLAHPRGRGCSFYSKGHHVLVVTPSWTDGKTDFRLIGGVGQLVGRAVGDRSSQTADTLEGAWDQAAMGIQGSLAFLKGDQMLAVTYLTSATDAAGAVRLARIAVNRMANAPARQP